MKINKAHCFFEQSGTFKNEFIIGKQQVFTQTNLFD